MHCASSGCRAPASSCVNVIPCRYKKRKARKIKLCVDLIKSPSVSCSYSRLFYPLRLLQRTNSRSVVMLLFFSEGSFCGKCGGPVCLGCGWLAVQERYYAEEATVLSFTVWQLNWLSGCKQHELSGIPQSSKNM